MRAAILQSLGTIIVDERTVRAPAAGEVQIGVRYVGVCGSDLASFDDRLAHHAPVVFGHEFSGHITALGTGVSNLNVGDAVAVAPLLSCGICRFCLSAQEYLCRARRIFGVQVDGALQDLVCVPARCVFPLAERVALLEGALIEPLAVAVHAIRQSENLHDANVLVLGAGAIGLLIAQVARIHGARQVLMLDIAPARLELATQLGFANLNTNASDPATWLQTHTDGHGADILFEATGAPAVARHLVALLAPRGTIVQVGRMGQPVPFDLDALLFKEGRLVTSRYFSLRDFEIALRLLAEQSVAVAPLIQQVVPFDQLREQHGARVMDAARQVVRLLIAMENKE